MILASPPSGGLGYMGVAFVVVWVAIGCYLIVLDRRQRSIDKRLKELSPPESAPSE